MQFDDTTSDEDMLEALAIMRAAWQDRNDNLVTLLRARYGDDMDIKDPLVVAFSDLAGTMLVSLSATTGQRVDDILNKITAGVIKGGLHDGNGQGG